MMPDLPFRPEKIPDDQPFLDPRHCVDYLEMLFSVIPMADQDELLGPYEESLHEEELGVQYGGNLRQRAISSMLDNANDCREILARHLGFCIRSLIKM